MSQDACRWNRRFASKLCEPGLPAREVLTGRDARTRAREDPEDDAAEVPPRLTCSPMRRAKLPAMRRNAAVVLGSVGTVDDIDMLTRAIYDAEALVRLRRGSI